MRTSVFTIAFIAIIALFNSCSKQDDETRMNVILSPAASDYNIPITASISSGEKLGEISISYDLDAMIKVKNQRFGIGNINEIKLTGFVMDLDTAVAGNSYANIENISLSITAAGLETSPVLATASTPESPATALTKSLGLNLTATDNDLKSYLTGSNAKFVLTGKLRRATTIALKGKATATFKVSMSL